MDILLNTESVKQDPIPFVLFENFGESTLDFRMVFWNDISTSNAMIMKSDIRYKVNEKFKELKIEMAFPQRDVTLKLTRPLDVKLLS